jgi:hypothetical protein
MTTAAPRWEKHFSSSILLWVRDDQDRQTGMDYWRGPHSGIISATPGLHEYRQIHLAAVNDGLWPDQSDVETAIPADRRVDGIAEVTFRNAFSPALGRAQTQLAYADEVNVFRRTLLYAGPPGSSRWYSVGSGEVPGARALLHLRRKDDVSGRAFRSFVADELVPSVAGTGVLRELRTQTFLPWVRKLWDTPNVAHDNPAHQRIHASVVLGFDDGAARTAFFASEAVAHLSQRLPAVATAVHAYEVSTTLTYVQAGIVLSRPAER